MEMKSYLTLTFTDKDGHLIKAFQNMTLQVSC